ncbi:MAG: hypothetical protein ACE5K7_07840 [Phycisphaerae bacterium]
MMRAGRALAATVWVMIGCMNIEAPREIRIGAGPTQAELDSTRIPKTTSHEQARQELRKAYYRIGQLERENARLRQQRDEYKAKYKRLRDRYERD